MKTDHRLNKLEKKIELLFSKKTNAIGFGKSSIDEKKRKLLLFIESNSITKDHSNTIDGIIITNFEPTKLKKIKDDRIIGLKYPDKVLDINDLNKNNYDFVIIDDQKLDYKYLDNDSKTIFQINENISDDDADIISSFDFPLLYIETTKNLNFKEIESFFNLGKITSKFSTNYILKINTYLDKDQIQILFNLGVIGLVLDSQISEKKIINKFNDNLVNLNTDKKKSNSVPDLSSNLSSSPIEDDFDD